MEEKKKYITQFEFTLQITPLEYSKDGELKKENTLMAKAPNGSHTELLDEFLESTKSNTIIKKMLASGLCYTKKDNVLVNEIMLDELDIRDLGLLIKEYVEVFFSIL